MQGLILTPSDFVAVLNQTLEYAYPSVSIVGELSNFRVSKGNWVYFDLKDEQSSVKFFGTIYNLPGPLEDGLMLQVTGQPKLSPLYGFSVTIQSVTPVGKGSIKCASDLLMAKLDKEGLFDPERKRALPYPPAHIGLIASKESAAYADFVKIINARWAGVKISHVDVQVQGEKAVAGVVSAIELLNQQGQSPEVIVITRGGGSADDLAAFSTEQVTRAVAGSRIPTLVAIGHEVDLSLAELACDQRASTPSNAAELLVPDKSATLRQLSSIRKELRSGLKNLIVTKEEYLKNTLAELRKNISNLFLITDQKLSQQKALVEVLNPQNALRRGYAIIRDGKGVLRSIKQLVPGQNIEIQFYDGKAKATVKEVQ